MAADASSSQLERLQPLGSTDAGGPLKMVGAFTLSVVLAIVLLGVLVTMAGPWEFIAVTRLLDPLVEGGLVQYHDLGPGFIPGLPEVGYYYMSQDLIDWRLIVVSSAFMAAYSFLKAIQFDRIARAFGSTATFGDHLRGYFYGDGIDRFLPFGIGRAARAEILAKSGLSRDRAYEAVQVQQSFTLFEIAFFAVIGLFLLGWSSWLSQMVWAVACLLVAYFIVSSSVNSIGPRAFLSLSEPFSALMRLAAIRPGLVFQLGIISVFAFALVDLAIYLAMTGFDTEVVLINVDKPVLLMGIVGGYIAARILPVTAGGIGQWELGFATGLFLGGADVSVAMFAIAVIANLIRIGTGLILMGLSMIRYEMPVNLSEICAVAFRR
jgi:hypothetical protein